MHVPPPIHFTPSAVEASAFAPQHHDSAVAECAMRILSNTLELSWQQIAELHERFDGLLQTPQPASRLQPFNELSLSHLSQLKLASRVLAYSLKPPYSRPQPTQLDAYLWEWAIMMQETVEPIVPRIQNMAHHCNVWLDADMLSPLMQGYVHAMRQKRASRTHYQLSDANTETRSVILHQEGVEVPPASWRSARSVLLEQTNTHAAAQYDLLLIAYAALIEPLQPCHIWMAGQGEKLAFKLTFTPLETLGN